MNGVPLAERLTLANQWERMALRVWSGMTISATQHRECRRFFYAGAAAWSDLMIGGLDGTHGDGDHEPTDADMEYMTALHRELEEFGKAIQAGRA